MPSSHDADSDSRRETFERLRSRGSAENSHGTADARTLPRRVLEGAKGGLVATVVMTAYRFPVSRALPPTALFWSEYVSGGDPNDHPVPGIVLHLLYGTVAGSLFGALFPEGPRTTVRREEVGLLGGVAYAIALSVFGERVVLKRVLGMDLDADDALVFHVGHVVYGLTLGTWTGSRTSDRG